MNTAHCIFINCIAVAKQGDNAFGGVHSSVCPFVCAEPHEPIESRVMGVSGQDTRTNGWTNGISVILGFATTLNKALRNNERSVKSVFVLPDSCEGRYTNRPAQYLYI